MIVPCKGCVCPIEFLALVDENGPVVKEGKPVRIPLDKRSPVYRDNGDGTCTRVDLAYVSHFRTCPAAQSFSATRKSARRLEETPRSAPKAAAFGLPGPIVHVLHEGRTLCGVTQPPSSWPAGATWMSKEQVAAESTKGYPMCDLCMSQMK